jgi:hypothetical protein
MCNYVQESTRIMRQCETPLSRAFFSEANVDVIQSALISQVEKKTGQTIGRQTDREVVGVMRGVYEAYSSNYGDQAEINRLNAIVLDIVVDQCVAGVKGYLGYIKDASTMPEPLSRGTFASIKGERTLEYKVGF